MAVAVASRQEVLHRKKQKWAFCCRPISVTLGMVATQGTETLFGVAKALGVTKTLSLCALWGCLQRLRKTLEIETARLVRAGCRLSCFVCCPPHPRASRMAGKTNEDRKGTTRPRNYEQQRRREHDDEAVKPISTPSWAQVHRRDGTTSVVQQPDYARLASTMARTAICISATPSACLLSSGLRWAHYRAGGENKEAFPMVG